MPMPLKRLLPIVAFLGACRAPAPFTAEERQAIVEDVTATLNDLTEAINAHEPERAMAFYTDAPEFLFLGCTDIIANGASFKQMVGPTYGPTRGATFEQPVLAVQALSPTSAVAFQQGSSNRAPALFWTRVLVKEGDRWVITYEHQSWPDCDPPRPPHP